MGAVILTTAAEAIINGTHTKLIAATIVINVIGIGGSIVIAREPISPAVFTDTTGTLGIALPWRQ